MMIYQKWIAVLVVLQILQLSCTVEIAGNGSQTGNPMITGMIYTADGTTPACNANVYLRKRFATGHPVVVVKQYTDTVAVTRTDCDGKFTINSIDTGLYVIEGTDGGNNLAFVDSVPVHYSDSTIILPPAILRPAGAVKGRIRLSEGGDPRKVFVIIPALDRFTTADSNGMYKFEHLAAGHYTINILPTLDNYGVFDTINIPVTSADTTNLGVITLLFTGIPTIRNLAVSYDTLHQQVSLSWSKPGTSLVKSFNVYRREVDPATAVTTQLNFFPIIDTFFIDSLCEQNKSYEYHVTAVDTHTNEGARSPGATTRIALYNILPENVVMDYDTLRQTVTLRWSSPDTALVKSYNIYRRNVRLNEKFWTPFNNSPIRDTFFTDSTFILCPNSNFACDDSMGSNEPVYEYCVAALIKNVREGVKSTGISIRINLKYLTPTKVNVSYDTLKQKVTLRWGRSDTTLVKSFNIFRKNCTIEGDLLTQLNNTSIRDTFAIDSTAEQNQTYEYYIAAIVRNNRAQVKSAGMKVRIAASFAPDSVFNVAGNGREQLSFPNDIAVSVKGDIYIVDQGNSRVQVYDSAMRHKRTIGKNVLHYPLKVCVDSHEFVFVADYDVERDFGSVYIFDPDGAVVDTILDSMAINDIDVSNNLLYAVTEGRTISVFSHNETALRSWQTSGQDVKSIVADDNDTIFVGAGSAVPTIGKVIVFDSLGSRISSITLPHFPGAIAYDNKKQWLYIVCADGDHGNMLHVLDKNLAEVASYKISEDEQNISIGLHINGAVFLVLKGEGKIYKLKPLFQ